MQVCLLPKVGGLDFTLSSALNPQLDPKEDELTQHKECRNSGTTQQLPAPLRLIYLRINRLCFIYSKGVTRCVRPCLGTGQQLQGIHNHSIVCTGLIFLSLHHLRQLSVTT